jgi:hypothetical protein
MTCIGRVDQSIEAQDTRAPRGWGFLLVTLEPKLERTYARSRESDKERGSSANRDAVKLLTTLAI